MAYAAALSYRTPEIVERVVKDIWGKPSQTLYSAFIPISQEGYITSGGVCYSLTAAGWPKVKFFDDKVIDTQVRPFLDPQLRTEPDLFLILTGICDG